MWLDDAMEGLPAPWTLWDRPAGTFYPAPFNRLADKDGEGGRGRVLPR